MPPRTAQPLSPTATRQRWLARVWAALRGTGGTGGTQVLPLVEEYEPRLMYSADLAPQSLLLANIAQPTQPVEQRVMDAQGAYAAAQTQTAQPVELLFVDAGVANSDLLVKQLSDAGGRTIEVVVLSANADGIGQISAALAGRSDVAALHILSHGADGEIQIGDTTLDAATLAARGAEVAQWGRALAANADILLYGCDVAADATGDAFVQQLAALTGADVAASSNLTGNVALGGDWTLEYSTGLMHSGVAFTAIARDAWVGTLATFTVTNNSPGVGSGSLGKAIADANAASGADTIVFNISGTGVHTITVSTPLTITGALTIDGTVNNGATANGGLPGIILDGSNQNINGLTLANGSDGSTIRGLVIRNFNGDGIQIQQGSDGNTITDNFIGNLQANGTSSSGGLSDANSGAGIHILSQGNTVGGTTTADRNVISGNTGDGVWIEYAPAGDLGGTNNVIIGNTIGTEIDGTTALPNQNGVKLDNGANWDVVTGNLISRNTGSGILVSDTGTAVHDLLIGESIFTSLNSGVGNTISFNGGDGITMVSGTSNAISSNSIYSNTGLGIDLRNGTASIGVTPNDSGDADTGANNLQNFPLLVSANLVTANQAVITVNFNSAANAYYRFEFFSSTSKDPSGNGEGQTYLGALGTNPLAQDFLQTDGSGNLSFTATINATLPLGRFISATATKIGTVFGFADGVYFDTSEFSNAVALTNAAPVLDSGPAPALVSVAQNAPAPVGAVGTAVSSLVDFAIPAGQVDNVTDADTGALLGIAITAVDSTNGTLYYSTNGGTSWSVVGPVSDSSARLLSASDANARLYYQPVAGFTGTLGSAVTFRAWDQTSGSNGGLADTTTNGGSTAFSANTDVVSLTVNAGNTAPVITSNGGGATASINVAENTTAVTTVTATDSDVPAQTLTYSIVAGGDGGKFSINSTTGALTFASAPNYENPTDSNGDNVYNVTVQVSDGALTDTQVIAVTVTNVNEAPTAQNDVYAVASNSTLTVPATSGLLANDSDPENDALTVITGTAPSHGTLSLTPGALGTFTNLTNNATSDLRGAWSPDGSKIAFDTGRDGNNEIYVMNADGSGLVRLTNNSADDSQAAWSPDGSKIAFMSNRSGSFEVWVMNASNGSGLVQLTNTGSSISGQPDWSPDGSKIAFTSDRSGNYEIYTMNANGTGLTRLTTASGDDTEPVWSPDGTKIAFAATRDGNNEIYVMNADGSGQTRLTNNSAIDRSPVWSPDGSKLAFISDRSGTQQIYMMDVTGANPTAVTTAASGISFPDWSADGLKLLFTFNNEIESANASFNGGFVYTPTAGYSGADSFTYTVSDRNGHTSSATVAINVNAVNVAPVITSNGGGATAALSVAENSSAVTTVTASDADLPAQTLTYSIVAGGDGSQFSINSSSGVLTFATPPNYEAPTDSNGDNVYNVTVQVSDGSLVDTQALAVTVTPVNDNTPAITSNGGGATAAISVAENSTAVTTVTATDADLPAQTLTYSIVAGGDGAKFSLNGSTGVLTFAAAPNYEAPTDSNGDNIYNVTVHVSDGTLSDTQTIAVTVTPVNDDTPVITSNGGGATAAISVAENNTAVTTVTATDADLPAQTLTYSIVAGGDGGRFSLNGSTGVLTFATAPNYEAPTDSNGDNVYNVTVQVSDGTLVNTQTIAVTVTPVNDNAPVITSNGGGATAAISVAENSTAVTTVTATDADLPVQTLAYRILAGGDGAKFSINSSTGVLTFATAPNYEAPTDSNGDNVYNVTVRVSDGSLTDTQVIAVTVTPVNDNTPVITSNGGGATAAISVAENSTAVTTVTATDADLPAQALTYSIVAGGDGGKFSLNSSTGVLTFATAPNYEAPTDSNGDNVYNVTVQVSDGSLVDTQAIAVTVTPVNDNTPVITSNGGGATAAISVAENSTAVTTVTATDADLPAQTLTYSIVAGGDGSQFSINSSTGVLTFATAPNYEAPTDSNGDNVYNVTVQVSDGSLVDTQALAVAVTNLNEAPLANNDVLASTEDVPVTYTAAQLLGNDADVDSSVLSIASVSSGTGGTVVLNSNGTVTFTPIANFNGAANFSYQATDGGLTSNAAVVTVNVAAVNDAPTVVVPGAQTVAQGASLTISGVSADDVDGNLSAVQVTAVNGTLTVTSSGSASLAGNGSVALAVSGTQADINATLASLRYRGAGGFAGADTLSVRATDSAGANASQTIGVTVGGVNTVATIGGVTTGAVTEDSAPLLVATGALTIVDPDIGQANFAAQSGTVGSFGTFTLDTAGDWRYSANNNQQAIQQLAAGATLRETFSAVSADGSATQAIVVTISGVNDIPLIAGVVSGAVTEDSAPILTASGALTISDADSGESSFVAQASTAGAYGAFSVDAAGNWSYQAANSNPTIQRLAAGETVSDRFVVTSADGSASQDVTVSIAGVDEAILGTNTGASVNEGASITLTPAMLAVSGATQGAASVIYTVVTVPADGQLSLSGQALKTGTQFTQADIDSGKVAYTHDGSETLADAFSVAIADGNSVISGPAVFAITIRPVNDAPVAADQTLATLDTASVTFKTTDFGYADAEGDKLAKILITALPSTGTLVVNNAPVAQNQEIAAADIAAGNLRFVPQSGLPVAVTTAFGFKVSDGALFSAASHTVTLQISPSALPPPATTAPAIPVAEPSPGPATTAAVSEAIAPAKTVTPANPGGATLRVATPPADSLAPLATSLATTGSAPIAAATRTGGLADTAPTRSAAFGQSVPQGAITTFMLEGLAAQIGIETQKALELPVAERAASATSNAVFIEELDRLRSSVKSEEVLERNIVVSSVATGAGMSVGYVLWLLRGGLLMSSLLSSLPAWRFVDPLPVLGRLRDDGEAGGDDEDDDTLESIVNSGDATPIASGGTGNA